MSLLDQWLWQFQERRNSSSSSSGQQFVRSMVDGARRSSVRVLSQRRSGTQSFDMRKPSVFGFDSFELIHQQANLALGLSISFTIFERSLYHGDASFTRRCLDVDVGPFHGRLFDSLGPTITASAVNNNQSTSDMFVQQTIQAKSSGILCGRRR